MEVARVSREDEGTYSCLARNSAGESEDRVQVIVKQSEQGSSYNNYKPQPDPEHPPVGENRNRYPPVQYQQPARNNRYPAVPYQPPVRDNRYPVLQNPPASLPSVVIPVQAVEHEVNSRVGMNVDLTCVNMGSMPDNSEVVWSRPDGRPIASTHTTGQGVLRMKAVQKSDEGVYLCQLIETGGRVLFKLYANLVVQGPSVKKLKEK